MLALPNPVYLLLTDKTKRERYFDDYIYIKSLYIKGHKTQVDIYFSFAMQLKNGIDPFHQA